LICRLMRSGHSDPPVCVHNTITIINPLLLPAITQSRSITTTQITIPSPHSKNPGPQPPDPLPIQTHLKGGPKLSPPIYSPSPIQPPLETCATSPFPGQCTSSPKPPLTIALPFSSPSAPPPSHSSTPAHPHIQILASANLTHLPSIAEEERQERLLTG
jgi:hypothetical protein